MCPALEAMSKRGSASRKYRVVSKGPVLFARLYDVFLSGTDFFLLINMCVRSAFVLRHTNVTTYDTS